MEENFSLEWKIFSMEWKWNGRKFPEWNMEKSSSIPFHTRPWHSMLRKYSYFWRGMKLNKGAWLP